MRLRPGLDRPGITSLYPDAGIHNFYGFVVEADDRMPGQHLDQIRARARFVDVDGTIIAAEVSELSRKDAEEPFMVTMMGGSFEYDSWYWLVIDEDAVVAVDDPTPRSREGAWANHFFTGSAPHVVSAEWSTAAGTGHELRVGFSEPLAMGIGSSDGEVRLGGATIGQPTAITYAAEFATFALTAELPEALADSIEIDIADGLFGSGRRFGETAAAGIPIVDGVQRVTIPPCAWFDCGMSGQCWREVWAPP